MIYNRKTKEYYEETGSRSLLFLYETLFGRMILKLLTMRWFSLLGGKYMDSSLSKRRIPKFISQNHILMEEYEEKEYTSFNDFFTRKIKPSSRKLSQDVSLFLSPADAKLTVYPIEKDTCFWIKNSCYTVEELLQDKQLAEHYQGGYCFLYRLGVDDYHRYSYIDNGTSMKRKKIRGVFHTVQPIACKRYKVFSENTREYEVLKTDHFSTIVQMEIGALLVGKIENTPKETFKRGEEKGYFCFGGSTILLLVEKDRVIPDSDILENSRKDIETRVYLYEPVGRKGL